MRCESHTLPCWAFWTLLSVALGLVQAQPALAQAIVPGAGQGTWIIAWQNAVVHDHLQSDGSRLSIGPIHTEGALLAIEYGLTDRLAVSVSIPYLHKKYVGPRPHDPSVIEIDDPVHGHIHPHAELLDDGRYHGHWQDWNLKLRWQWRSEPLVLTPFFGVGIPSHNYTYFAHAAPGTRQKRLDLGIDSAKRLSDRWYLAGGYAFSLHERVLGIRIRTSTVNLDLGVHATERLTLRMLAHWRKGHNGLAFPEDFPLPRTTELWFNHDRIQRIDSLEVGLGLVIDLNEHYRAFGTWLTQVDGASGHELHNAVVLGLARSF